MQTRASRNLVRGNHRTLPFGKLFGVLIVLVLEQKGNICTPSCPCVRNPDHTSTQTLDPWLRFGIRMKHKVAPRVYSYCWPSQMSLDNDKATGEEVHGISRRKYSWPTLAGLELHLLTTQVAATPSCKHLLTSRARTSHLQCTLEPKCFTPNDGSPASDPSPSFHPQTPSPPTPNAKSSPPTGATSSTPATPPPQSTGKSAKPSPSACRPSYTVGLWQNATVNRILTVHSASAGSATEQTKTTSFDWIVAQSEPNVSRLPWLVV